MNNQVFNKASWIWKENRIASDDYARFFSKFNLCSKNAQIYISCDTNYEIYVNGKLASFGQYADYPYHKVYDEIDLSDYSNIGENQISILVWYYGVETFTYYNGKPGLIFAIYENGKCICSSGKDTLCKDPKDYICGRKKELTEQLGYSYSYRAKEYDGCNEAGFTPIQWKNSTILSGRPTEFYERPIKKLITKPIKIGKKLKEFNCIYDLGEETVGYLFFQFKASLDTLVTISWGEHLTVDESGKNIVPRILKTRDFSVEIYGNGNYFTFSNYLRRIGARYIQVNCEEPIEIVKIGLIPVEYPLTVKEFKIDNVLRQKIYDVSIHTLRCCMFEHYEDCPWREQSLYNVDSRNQMLFGYAAFEEYPFAKASIELYGLDKRDDGLLNMCVPSCHDLVIPFFALFWIIQMKEYTEASKDISLIIQYRSKVQQLLDIFMKRKENGLIPIFDNDIRYWNFYEWNEDWKGMCHKEQPYGFDVMLNCTVSIALQCYEYMLQQIGEFEIAKSIKKEYETLNISIKQTFLDNKCQMFKNTIDGSKYSILGNSFAILARVVQGEDAKQVCANMLKHENITEATLSMKCFQYDAMLLCDKNKYKNIILEEIDKNYGMMLECGATSFWETLKGASDFHNAGSLCHGWSALPIYYYQKLL